MIRWLVYLIPHFLAVIARYPLAPLAVIFFSTDDKRHLTFFKWLETIDNDLSGDEGWRAEHITGDPLSTWNRIGWLWRNGGNALNYGLLGCDYISFINPFNRAYFKRFDGYWVYRNFWQISSTRNLEVFLGWALYGPQLGRCKIVFTIRFPTIKE